jgi:ABC-type sugar transport system ATPase subunit
MARITLEHIRKTFTKGKVVALDDVSLDIKDNEFFVLFGPAGAGKTTILNNIAGIQVPDEGIVKIDGEIVNLVDAAHRDTAMVFENYALYPQMTVYDNMASPLRSNLYKKDEEYIKNRIQGVAEMMKMDYLLERLPSQLSNGQKQRVAMGRALVREPKVYLMDEPLAHLDAKLRSSMRTELKEIQANFNTTTIYVTHDFMEALALGDRIAIIDKGKVVQVGIGEQIYYMPTNEFVSQLMGDPEINLIPCELKKADGKYTATLKENGVVFELPYEENLYNKLDAAGITKVDMGLRPADLKYSFEPKDGYMKCSVYSYESMGNKSFITAKTGEQEFRVIAPNGLAIKLDQDVYISLDIAHSLYFDAETTNFIARYDEAYVMDVVAELQKEGKL